jgi:ribosome-associated toxin RatA of RatAB toxin-antitoxin module
MNHVKKSVLLGYSAREMYDLVVGVEDYPRFLPWCDKAEVLERSATGMTARLGLHYAGLRHVFTTRNTHQPAESVLVQLVDGPFSQLDGRWLFQPLGSGATRACKIDFELRYAFSSLAFEAVLSPVFDRVANTLVDCFVKRAEAVHGPR